MEIRCAAKNGADIFSYKNPSLHGFYISLFVRAGSMYEGEEERGITHFLEHTLVRNVNRLRGDKLYRELDENGIEFNASTYSEMVQFYAFGASENFSLGAQIIASVLSPIVLGKADIDTERKRIKAEIRESDDKSSLANFSMNAVFEGTTLQSSILGTNGSVDKISGKRLEEYRRRVFNSENVFIYVTGNFTDKDIEELKALVGACELAAAQPHDVHTNIAPVPKAFGKREEHVRIKNADYTMARFTFDVDMQEISSPVLDLIYDMLLSGYNSPFFVKMSEERGMLYDISGATERYRNIGTLHFTYEVREKSIYDSVQLCVKILNEFKSTLYAPSACMKTGYVENALLLYDDAREFNFTMAYDNHIMKLGYPSLQARIDAYKNITPEQIRAAACKIFRPENLTLTVKGNKKRIDAKRLEELVFALK